MKPSLIRRGRRDDPERCNTRISTGRQGARADRLSGRHPDRGGDDRGGLVLSARAGDPALSALPRAALRLLSRDPSRCAHGACGAGGAPRPLLLAGLAILALAALGNAGLGTYHSGVEWGLWKGPTDCSGPVVNLGSAGDLLSRLDTVKVVRCDEVQWRFLGLSLAGYNVLISLSMAAIAAWGFVRTAQRT